MACTRDRIIEIVDYIRSYGIEVNIGKNKAQGNKGFFKARGGTYRIDISKNTDEDSVLEILIHEFAHYIHFKYDKTLQSLDFLFDNYDSELENELVELTVDSIPKSAVEPLFEAKTKILKRIEEYYQLLKTGYSDIKKSYSYPNIEKLIKKTDAKYLLKNDRVKLVKGFSVKLFQIDNIENDFPKLPNECVYYLRLKSSQSHLKRINSAIQRRNRYYSSSTELLARSFEYYFCKPDKMRQKAPKTYKIYQETIKSNKIQSFTDIFNILNCSEKI